MTLEKIIKKLREEHKEDTSWEFTNYYDDNSNLSHIVYVFRWVDNKDVLDIEIKGSSLKSSDWRVVKEKHTNSYMELYKPNFD